MDSFVDHRQLHEMVAERLRSAILDGDLKPGTWLRQERIAKELGVSSMPVREALNQLAAEGVVQHIPYRGARVTQFSPDDVADLYAKRSHLESLPPSQPPRTSPLKKSPNYVRCMPTCVTSWHPSGYLNTPG